MYQYTVYHILMQKTVLFITVFPILGKVSQVFKIGNKEFIYTLWRFFVQLFFDMFLFNS